MTTVARELLGLTTDEILAKGIWIEDRQLRSATKQGAETRLYFGTGEILLVKNHERIDSLSFPRQSHGSDRIQRYGDFGTSI
jgi:hypothetical protein